MATIETNTVENKSTKIIKYGSWNFEYSQKGNIYSSDIESFDNNKFNHFDFSERRKIERYLRKRKSLKLILRSLKVKPAKSFLSAGLVSLIYL